MLVLEQSSSYSMVRGEGLPGLNPLLNRLQERLSVGDEGAPAAPDPKLLVRQFG